MGEGKELEDDISSGVKTMVPVTRFPNFIPLFNTGPSHIRSVTSTTSFVLSETRVLLKKYLRLTERDTTVRLLFFLLVVERQWRAKSQLLLIELNIERNKGKIESFLKPTVSGSRLN